MKFICKDFNKEQSLFGNKDFIVFLKKLLNQSRITPKKQIEFSINCHETMGWGEIYRIQEQLL